ncbi:hypothetical protein HDU99_008290, partial [Rhizoclosmatium hyalinum]
MSTRTNTVPAGKLSRANAATHFHKFLQTASFALNALEPGKGMVRPNHLNAKGMDRFTTDFPAPTAAEFPATRIAAVAAVVAVGAPGDANYQPALPSIPAREDWKDLNTQTMIHNQYNDILRGGLVKFLDDDLAKYFVVNPANPQTPHQQWTTFLREIDHHTTSSIDTRKALMDRPKQLSHESALQYMERLAQVQYELSLDGFPAAADINVTQTRWGERARLGLHPDTAVDLVDSFRRNVDNAGVAAPRNTIVEMVDFLAARSAFLKQLAAQRGDDDTRQVGSALQANTSSQSTVQPSSQHHHVTSGQRSGGRGQRDRDARDRDPNEVFVRNLPPGISEEAVKNAMSRFGPTGR